LHSTKIDSTFAISKQLNLKIMKKFFLSIYFAALIAMFPALFVGYLYNNYTPKTNEQITKQTKIDVFGNDETVFKPGLLFVIKEYNF
jgi:hypothetical protein